MTTQDKVTRWQNMMAPELKQEIDDMILTGNTEDLEKAQLILQRKNDHNVRNRRIIGSILAVITLAITGYLFVEMVNDCYELNKSVGRIVCGLNNR